MLRRLKAINNDSNDNDNDNNYYYYEYNSNTKNINNDSSDNNHKHNHDNAPGLADAAQAEGRRATTVTTTVVAAGTTTLIRPRTQDPFGGCVCDASWHYYIGMCMYVACLMAVLHWDLHVSGMFKRCITWGDACFGDALNTSWLASAVFVLFVYLMTCI